MTARITARPDTSKSTRSKLQVTGVAPPLSSVIVERHHPVTQVSNLIFFFFFLTRILMRGKLKSPVFCLSVSPTSASKRLPSSLTPPNRATALLQAGVRPELKQAHATSTPSKWLSDPMNVLISSSRMSSRHLKILKSSNWLYCFTVYIYCLHLERTFYHFCYIQFNLLIMSRAITLKTLWIITTLARGLTCKCMLVF